MNITSKIVEIEKITVLKNTVVQLELSEEQAIILFGWLGCASPDQMLKDINLSMDEYHPQLKSKVKDNISNIVSLTRVFVNPMYDGLLKILEPYE